MSKYTAFRCQNDLFRRAKLVADGERRSLSNYIIWLLEQDLIRRALRDHEQTIENHASQHLYSRADSA
jgi:hypothetical protein